MRSLQEIGPRWTLETHKERSMREILRNHDIGSLFAFLASRGWSRTAIGAATGMDPARVREIIRGKRRVTSYEVLVRIADGLGIERGLMGPAFTDRPPVASCRRCGGRLIAAGAVEGYH